MAHRSRRLRQQRLSSTGLIVCFLCAEASAQTIGPELPAAELRLDLSQLYSLDDATGRHLSFSELRGTIDARRVSGGTEWAFSFDGRGRYGWTEITAALADVNRAYVSVSGQDWALALGRQVITPANGARVDGASAELAFSDEIRGLIFGGAMPHPLTGALTEDLLTAGAGYDARFSTFEQSGGVVASWYRGEVDRIYLTERVSWRPDAAWLFFGQVLLDLVSPIDLTQANVTLRWRPSLLFDLSLQGSHFHTLLPNLWWQDYLERERARRGFVIDGIDPVGSRRSYLRAVFDLHLSPNVSPYLVLRGDRRHEDGTNGSEATLGLKLNDFELGYLDLSATLRDYFGAPSQLAIVSAGTELSDAIGFDASFSALRVPWMAGEPELLYDLNAALWMDLRAIAEPLGDIRLMAMSQTFIDPEMTLHIFYLRLGYRFRD